MRMNKAAFADEVAQAKSDAQGPARRACPANPIYLPAPHEVAEALYTAFITPPPTKDSPWLHQSLWHSIQVIFWGFVISSVIGVPLGILCGTYAGIARLSEPFIEFFRYLPAPAFGALAVAILGIYDGPKITIIVIGTFFQQVLIIANTTRKLDVGAGGGRAHARHQEAEAAHARGHSRHLARSLSRPAHPARLGLDLSHRRRADRHHHRASPGSSPSRRATSISPMSMRRS